MPVSVLIPFDYPQMVRVPSQSQQQGRKSSLIGLLFWEITQMPNPNVSLLSFDLYL